MNNKAIDYFFAEFDYLIRNGRTPREALLKTADDYAYVFHDIKSRDNEYKTLVINVKNLNNEIQNFLDKYNKEKEPQIITNKTVKMTTNREIDDLPTKDYENKQKIKKIARFLCKYHGFNQDEVIYDNAYYRHLKWTEYSDLAKRILEELNK